MQRLNRSIDYALVSFKEAVEDTLNSKRFGGGIFIDLKKAFDTRCGSRVISDIRKISTAKMTTPN